MVDQDPVNEAGKAKSSSASNANSVGAKTSPLTMHQANPSSLSHLRRHIEQIVPALEETQGTQEMRIVELLQMAENSATVPGGIPELGESSKGMANTQLLDQANVGRTSTFAMSAEPLSLQQKLTHAASAGNESSANMTINSIVPATNDPGYRILEIKLDGKTVTLEKKKKLTEMG